MALKFDVEVKNLLSVLFHSRPSKETSNRKLGLQARYQGIDRP
jgi:hypothetical protein